MRERYVDIHQDLYVELGEPNQQLLKALLTRGLHAHPAGHEYEVVSQWVPDDAVVSQPEFDSFEPGVRFYVLSDEFTEADPPYLNPVAAGVWAESQRGS